MLPSRGTAKSVLLLAVFVVACAEVWVRLHSQHTELGQAGQHQHRWHPGQQASASAAAGSAAALGAAAWTTAAAPTSAAGVELLISAGHTQRRQLLQNPDVPVVDNEGRRGHMEDYLPKGYTLETHKVYTSDGFVLTTYRIPRGRDRHSQPGPRPVALLVHGFSLSSLSFSLFGPTESMAYILAETGFDVWIFNIRGNDFSRGNVKWNARQAEYWYSSIDQSALIDLPATLNYALDKTGASKALLLTHSQGGTLAYGMMTELPHMQDKVAALVALGPPVFMELSRAEMLVSWGKSSSPTVFGAPYASIGEFLTSRRLWTITGKCNTWANAEFCAVMTYTATYGVSANIPTDDLYIILNTWPSTIAARNIVHWAQMINDAPLRLQRFDHGTNCANRTRYHETCNQQAYGSLTPPEYDLSKVKVPVFIMQGSTDVMVVEEDVAEQQRRLPNCTRINVNGYAHMDFVWDRNAHHAFDVVDIFLRYAPGTF